MTSWGWRNGRANGFREGGIAWLQPLVAAVPWITVFLLFLLMCRVGDTFTLAKGTAFDLPAAEGLPEGVQTPLVALVMPNPKEATTLVFFDDARYVLGDIASERQLDVQLAQRLSGTGEKALLALADRRVPSGELMRFAALVRRSGARKVLFAEKAPEKGEE